MDFAYFPFKYQSYLLNFFINPEIIYKNCNFLIKATYGSIPFLGVYAGIRYMKFHLYLIEMKVESQDFFSVRYLIKINSNQFRYLQKYLSIHLQSCLQFSWCEFFLILRYLFEYIPSNSKLELS